MPSPPLCRSDAIPERTGHLVVGADLGAAVARQGLVDLVDVGGHRLEAGVESVVALLLDLLEGLLGLLGSLTRRLKL